ncbi:acyltransferase [Variovorax sp. J31P207]|uniref:acyltransferase family protein n=1 Tax=Variovorax sp. J31P207 TaxID=3053510 RepID=UPI0025773E42|nr:acyltransferase [Variovorax sp. J31P207]MDM0072070.1 acyltransferase [Variovorax sp. J31P207]
MKAVEAPQHKTIQFVEFLRAMACLLVVYCHVFGRPPIVLHQSWAPGKALADYFLDPLGIIQNFGFLGVTVFFLISGFIVTHTGLTESRFSFFVKRVFRIYPALVVTVVLTILLAKHAVSLGMQDPAIGIGYTSAALAALGFEAGFAKSAVIQVGWTITIELFFYLIMVALLPLLKRSPVRCMATILVMCALGAAASVLPFVHKTISHMFAYIPIFIIGMSVYFYWARRIQATTAIAFGAASFGTFIFCMAVVHPDQLAPSTLFGAQVVYAVAIFLAAIWFYGVQPVSNGPIIKFFADVSYSLYLVHLPISVFLAYRLFPFIGLTGSMVAGLVASVALSYAMFRWIEKPAQKVGRKLLDISARHRGHDRVVDGLQPRP